jgi:hypothetical protein
MLKKMFLATAVTGLVVGIALPVQAATTVHPGMTTVPPGTTCKDAAKMQYPGDRSARRAYKKACKEAWKGSKTAAVKSEPTYAGDI